MSILTSWQLMIVRFLWLFPCYFFDELLVYGCDATFVHMLYDVVHPRSVDEISEFSSVFKRHPMFQIFFFFLLRRFVGDDVAFLESQ